jgi:hypothetical protein
MLRVNNDQLLPEPGTLFPGESGNTLRDQYQMNPPDLKCEDEYLPDPGKDLLFRPLRGTEAGL